MLKTSNKKNTMQRNMCKRENKRDVQFISSEHNFFLDPWLIFTNMLVSQSLLAPFNLSWQFLNSSWCHEHWPLCIPHTRMVSSPVHFVPQCSHVTARHSHASFLHLKSIYLIAPSGPLSICPTFALSFHKEAIDDPFQHLYCPIWINFQSTQPKTWTFCGHFVDYLWIHHNTWCGKNYIKFYMINVFYRFIWRYSFIRLISNIYVKFW